MLFKYKKDQGRFNDLPKILKRIIEDMGHWLSENNLVLNVTATWTTPQEDAESGRKSLTHREKRAVDISVKNWSEAFIKEFVNYYNNRFKKYAAISKDTGLPTLCVYHDNGHGAHIHVQISRNHQGDDLCFNETIH